MIFPLSAGPRFAVLLIWCLLSTSCGSGDEASGMHHSKPLARDFLRTHPAAGGAEYVQHDSETRFAVAIDPGTSIRVPVRAMGPAFFSLSATTLGEPSSDWTISLMAKDGKELRRDRTATGTWNQTGIQIPDGFEVSAVHFYVGGDSKVWISEERIDPVSTESPTVVLITSDTHRGDHVGYFDTSRRVTTPRLDGLAKKGVSFIDCFAPANVTNPSHFALMTGLSPRDTRVTNNSTALSFDANTLSESFRKAGYRTFGAVSVLHLSPGQSNLHQGFDRYCAPPEVIRAGADTIDQLLGWIDDAEGAPLFIWLHVYDAHAPYTPPERLAERHYRGSDDPRDRNRSLNLPRDSYNRWVDHAGYTNREYVNALYASEVDLVDELIGKVLDVERVNKGIIAVTSDHGESLGEDGIWWDHTRLNHSTVHIPLILSWPEASPLRSTHPVELIDVGKTLLEIAGVDNSFPGRDLRSLSRGTTPATPRFSIGAHGWGAAVESGGWMLCLQIRPFFKNVGGRDWEHGETELYNLKTDPRAQNNVLEDNFERAKRMRKALTTWLNDGSATGLGSNIELGDYERNSLESLGYGGGTEGATEGGFWEPLDFQPQWNDRFR